MHWRPPEGALGCRSGRSEKLRMGGCPCGRSPRYDAVRLMSSITESIPPRLGNLLIALSLAVTTATLAATVSIISTFWWGNEIVGRDDRLVLIDGLPGVRNREALRRIEETKSISLVSFCDIGRIEYQFRNEAGRLTAAEVSSSFFDILGASVIAGRPFLRADEVAGGERVVVLSERFARIRFESPGSALGQNLRIIGIPYRIVGVAPWRLDVLGGADIFMLRPTSNPATVVDASESGARNIQGLIARLEPDSSVAQTNNELRQFVPSGRRRSPAARPIADVLFADVASIAKGSIAAAVCISLFGLSNTVLLFLCTLLLRERAFAVRIALGASRGRIAASASFELASVILAGTVVGLLLSYWGISLAATESSGYFRVLHNVRISSEAVVVAAIYAVGTLGAMTCCTLWVLRRLTSGDIALVLKGASGRSRPTSNLYRGIVVAELSLCIVLAMMAINATRTYWTKRTEDLGFAPNNLVTFELWSPRPLSSLGVNTGMAGYESVATSLRAIPGVSAVGFTSRLPLAYVGSSQQFVDAGDVGNGLDAEVIATGGDYPAAVGARQIRAPARLEGPLSKSEALATDELARRLWPSRSPHNVPIQINRGQPREVIGVIAPIRYAGLGSELPYQLYISYLDTPNPFRNAGWAVRGERAQLDLGLAIRSTLRDLVPDGIVYNMRTGEETVAEFFRPARMRTAALSMYSLFGLVIASVGVFSGTLAWLLANQRHAVIALILGATRPRIVADVAGGVGSLVACASVLGGSVGIWTSGILAALVEGVDPTPTNVMLAVLLVAAVAWFMAVFAAHRFVSRTSLVASE